MTSQCLPRMAVSSHVLTGPLFPFTLEQTSSCSQLECLLLLGVYQTGDKRPMYLEFWYRSSKTQTETRCRRRVPMDIISIRSLKRLSKGTGELQESKALRPPTGVSVYGSREPGIWRRGKQRVRGWIQHQFNTSWSCSSFYFWIYHFKCYLLFCSGSSFWNMI